MCCFDEYYVDDVDNFFVGDIDYWFVIIIGVGGCVELEYFEVVLV